MDLRAAAAERDGLLARRLDVVVPDLMHRHGFEAWVIVAREYNEDPVAATMLPSTWLGTARRRTILVFLEGGRDRHAIARYPVGPFPAAWDPTAVPDQWEALRVLLKGVEGRVGVDTSSTFALADGLSSGEHVALLEALHGHDVNSAEGLALGWLETRLPEERTLMADACRLAHDLLARALSSEVIEPDETTTEEVAWWLAQTSHEAGHGIWFHPGVSVQRAGDAPTTPASGTSDRVIQRGDLVHIDFGIIHKGYHTDQQQHAFVLADGERSAPEPLVRGLAEANRLQDILMSSMAIGVSGNDALSRSLRMAREEGLRPIVYTHPLGLHGHAAGSTIGLWDNQDEVPGAGDYPIGDNTGWSIELAAEVDVPEWGGQTVRIMLEEDAFLSNDEITFLDGRQEELYLIG